MAVAKLTSAEFFKEIAELEPFDVARIEHWLSRGDGVAIYENQDFGHWDLGHKQFMSYGSPDAFFETEEPPTRLPDYLGQINWRYQLKAVYKP